MVGGAFVTFLNWRYIFFINLPVGIAATGLGLLVLRERSPRIKARIDVVRMLILGGSLLLLLLLWLTSVTGSGVARVDLIEVAVGLSLSHMPAFIVYEGWYDSRVRGVVRFPSARPVSAEAESCLLPSWLPSYSLSRSSPCSSS